MTEAAWHDGLFDRRWGDASVDAEVRAAIFEYDVQVRLHNPDMRVVYVVQGEHGGPVKIGRSTLGGLGSRLSSLQTGNPYKLIVRCLLKDDSERSGAFERVLHDRFRHLALTGEWFLVDEEMLSLFPGVVDSTSDDHRAALVLAAKQGYDGGKMQGEEDGAVQAYDVIAGNFAGEVLRRVPGFRAALLETMFIYFQDDLKALVGRGERIT